MKLQIQVWERTGPSQSLILEMDEQVNGPPTACFFIGDPERLYSVKHPDLIDFCAAVPGTLQARRPRRE